MQALSNCAVMRLDWPQQPTFAAPKVNNACLLSDKDLIATCTPTITVFETLTRLALRKAAAIRALARFGVNQNNQLV